MPGKTWPVCSLIGNLNVLRCTCATAWRTTIPKGRRRYDCQCIVHARRNFVNLESDFPEECRKVVESFSAIYRVEAQAKAGGLPRSNGLQRIKPTANQ